MRTKHRLCHAFAIIPLLSALAAHAETAAPVTRLTVLVDNSVAGVPGVKAVWGFACLVEAQGHTVLFDTGANPAVLKENLAALKLDPSRIEAIVISHYHGDHTLGAPGLGLPPGLRVFTPRSFDGYTKIVAAFDAAGLVRAPVADRTELLPGIAVSEPMQFGGPISLGKRAFTDKGWEECLTVDTAEGLVVVVGCSHPGILAMLEQVRQRTGRPIALVIGGFHLLGGSRDEARSIAGTMKAMGVSRVSATHCTGGAAEAIFREVYADNYVDAGAGAVITVPSAGPQG